MFRLRNSFLKTDVIDHFPVVITLKIDGASEQSSKTKHFYKRSYDEENMKVFILTLKISPSTFDQLGWT